MLRRPPPPPPAVILDMDLNKKALKALEQEKPRVCRRDEIIKYLENKVRYLEHKIQELRGALMPPPPSTHRRSTALTISAPSPFSSVSIPPSDGDFVVLARTTVEELKAAASLPGHPPTAQNLAVTTSTSSFSSISIPPSNGDFISLPQANTPQKLEHHNTNAFDRSQSCPNPPKLSERHPQPPLNPPAPANSSVAAPIPTGPRLTKTSRSARRREARKRAENLGSSWRPSNTSERSPSPQRCKKRPRSPSPLPAPPPRQSGSSPRQGTRPFSVRCRDCGKSFRETADLRYHCIATGHRD
ncbi:hypothetical protein B0T21DRAFT_343613 [Apiosordaria backusii]|uniref:C2H2-type domain-containing protein n=1 Tax=Apiosordaria backusii TaxID=314023 RepID=A0AA40EYH9_9PEZI|nr:hypothetical protein B0T21DRAFT_343613 [Apiosordaria backusii]